MRSLLSALLSLATIATALAIDTKAAKDTEDWDEPTVPDTIFNGQTVPPMIELSSVNIAEQISKGNWIVEFYSPTCGHCTRFKPTWQTLYEFYYTSKPLLTNDPTEGDSLNSFTRYYDFKFAKIDCMAYRDACKAHDINGFPSIIQFKDGKEIQRIKGQRDLEDVSKWVEEILETLRPGSRVPGGPKLPKVGANSVETGPETKEEVEEKEDTKVKAPEKAKAKAGEKASSPEEVLPSSAVASTPTKASKAEPKKPEPTLNLAGISEPLTAETFPDRVTNKNEPWFIKFYAPWCHHCQAMRPNWEAMARAMKGHINIGEVNCDAEKKLCKDVGVRAYPTLLFFRGAESTEYNGLRGVGDLIAYAEKTALVSQGIPDVDLAAFEELEKTEEVIFVFFYDHATTSEDFMALDRLTINLIDKAKLVKTNDKEMVNRFKISTWPRFMVSRDGKPSYYAPLAPKDTRDTQKVLAWMKSVWLPVVPELTSSNAEEIMDEKYVVLGILNRENKEEFDKSKRELKNAALEWIDKQAHLFELERQELRDAKQLRIEEAEDRGDKRALAAAKNIRINMDELDRKQVGFAWVDGVFWERWIRTTYGVDVKEGERVIINDEDNKRYWDTTTSGEPIRPSRTYIIETVSKIVNNPSSIAAKSTSGTFSRGFFHLRNFCSGHPFLAFLIALGFGLTAYYARRSRVRRRGGHFQLNGNGLLGAHGGGGKKD
ncbi:thioredoxin-like protein [Sporormia fimetaria CBS 119925]|uniref:Thioredoxin-like protein n=1 Tax=Sporormia fimetaria CBS 119925 TaxID=1340428 RepID=A0A6A6VFQ2_9PLEO|nr:thioredoxin-like protein [Sporormia fimetaria CBS 119925]